MLEWIPSLPPSGKPRYVELADRIASDIEAGLLSPGDRLPPQRKLALALGIDFTTVSRGYAEAGARGLVQSHVGRGTFVRDTAPAPVGPDPRREAQIDLSMNLPPEPTAPDLIARMQDGLALVSANMVSLLRYQAPLGNPIDKEVASTWLSMRGLVPALERIGITPGAHPAILAILRGLAAPGEAILSETITYPGVRSIAALLGLRLVGVAEDAAGVLPDALDAAIRAHRPKALYLNPTLQNPTTRTIPTERRIDIAAVLSRHGLPLIEDDAYGFIPTAAPAPLAAYAPSLTWHIGGLAKCIGAGLRLAYVVAPDRRAALALEQAVKAIAVMASPVTIALATRWIEDGTADHIRRFIRSETRARQAIAGEILGAQSFLSDPVAFNIWLRLPPGWSRAELIGHMAGRGLGILPSDPFTVSGAPAECVRVCLGGRIGRSELQASLEFLAYTLEHSRLPRG